MRISSAWRSAVASEAIRLSALLAAASKGGGDQVADGAPAETARQAIERARAAAAVPAGSGPIGRLSEWWTGSSIETAWQALHLAGEQTMLMLPAEQISALLPGTSDPQVAQHLIVTRHGQADAQHQQIRALRNTTTVLLAVVLALDIALWAAGVTTGAIVGIGALGGALSVVFALRGRTPPGPYTVLLAQSLLKVASGAATALLAVRILDFASGVPASTARDAMYAVVFGFSQQMFTRLVDQRAGALAEAAVPRTAMPGAILAGQVAAAASPGGADGAMPETAVSPAQ